MCYKLTISTFQSKKSNATISTTINIWEKIIFRFRATNKGILFPSTTMIAHVPLIKNISMIVTSLFTCDKNVKVLKYIIFIDNLTYIKWGWGGDNTLGLCLFEYQSTKSPLMFYFQLRRLMHFCKTLSFYYFMFFQL